MLTHSLTNSLTYSLMQVGLLSLKRRGIVPSSDSNIVFHMNKWTKELMVKWGQIRDYLELNQFQMSINEQIFQTCLKVVGVLISPVDVHQVWIHALTKLNYINRVNSNSISSIGITLEELRRALCNDTSGTHSFTHSLTLPVSTCLLTFFKLSSSAYVRVNRFVIKRCSTK